MKSILRQLKGLAAVSPLLLAAPGALADYPAVVNSYNPLAYWRLNEAGPAPAPAIAANSSTLGALLNGYAVQAVTQGDPGIVGHAVGLHNGGGGTGHCGSKIDVPWSPILNPQPPFSVEFWVNPNSLTATDSTGLCPISNFDNNFYGGANRTGWLFYLAPTGKWNLRLGLTSGYALNLVGNTGLAQAGVWQHIAFTYDGLNVVLYANGAVIGTGTASGWSPNPNHYLRIGGTALNGDQASNSNVPFNVAASQEGNRGFDGYVDEVAIYGKVLSAATINAHFAAATTNNAGYHDQVLADAPLGYWEFEESASTVPDPSTLPLVVNSGSLGADANGTNMWGVVDAQPGPGYAGFGGGNSAVVMNGRTGNIAINDAAGLHGLLNITLMAWVKPAHRDYVRDILAQGLDSSEAETFLRIDRDANQDPTGYGDGGYYYEVGTTDGANYYASAFAPVPAGDIGNWVFLAGTYDGTAWTLYRNGLPVGTYPSETGIATVNAPWSIGSTSSGDTANGLRWSGAIDEPAIIGTALTATDILALYNAALVPPVITVAPVQPTGTVFAGSSLTFSIVAEGSPTLSYAWSSNGIPTGVTANTITVNNLKVGSQTIAVVVTNPYGSKTNAVTFNVVAAPPFFATAPVPVTRYTGYPFTFSVVAGGSAPITYQWKSNNVAIPGATSATYSGIASAATAGNYVCSLNNIAGSSNSAPVSLTVLPIPVNYPSAVLASTPIAYYRLGEAFGTNAFDYAGGNNGVYHSATLGQPGFSVLDSDTSVKFNGLNSYVGGISGTSVAFSGHTNFTVEAWVNGAAGQPDESSIIAKGTGSSGTTATEQFALDIAGGKYRFFTRGNNNSLYAAVATSGPDGTWQHVAGVYDDANGIITIYVNGVAQGSTAPRPAGLRVSTDPVTIGAKHLGNDPNYDGTFVGFIDEVAIYPTALDANTINSHFAAIYGSNTKPFFTKLPTATTNYAGLGITLSAGAAGSVPLSYQWYKGNSLISGATDASYTVNPVAVSDAGSYRILVSNGAGLTNSPAVALTVLTAPTSSPAIEGMVLHLPFDGDLLDKTGRGNNATAFGGPSYGPGQLGQAFNYLTDVTDTNNSVYQYALLAARPDLQFGTTINFSVSYWVQIPLNYTGGDLPFLCSATNSTFGTGLTFAPSYGSTAVPAPTTAFDGGWAFSAFDASGAGYGGYGVIGSINDGAWHHLVHVFDRSSGVVTYLDGVAATFSGQGGSAASFLTAGSFDTGPFGIGQDPTGTYQQTASGAIDDLAIYHKALTQLEAASVFMAGASNNLAVANSSFIKPLSFQVLPGNSLKLSWSAGSLQSADTVSGPYTPVAGAFSPYTATPTSAKKFYRVKL